MILGPGILAARAALILASANGQGAACAVTEAPAISVAVHTDEIQYDETQSSKALSAVKTDTASPYGREDTVTGGLRADQPDIRTKIEWSLQYNEVTGAACMAYSRIGVSINLHPRIYIAREFDAGECRGAVLGHERKHIKVDREVMNKYADVIGRALKEAVDRTGAMGPFNIRQRKAMEDQATAAIQATLKPIERALTQEMHERQQEVDSKAEYDRVGGICQNIRISR